MKELWRDGKGRGLSSFIGRVRYLSQLGLYRYWFLPILPIPILPIFFLPIRVPIVPITDIFWVDINMIPCQYFDYVRRFRPRKPTLYFAMAESGNNFRNSGHAWTTPAIGNLCSIINSKNNTSARMTLRSLFRVKYYETFRMLNGSAIYLSASLNSPIDFHFTHIAVSVYRRFRYYRIPHYVL